MTTLIIDAFWKDFLTSQKEPNRPMPEAWGFGRGAEMADRLGGLVAEGIKTATASLLWEYEAEGSQPPRPGDLSIILDGRGQPLCIIETVSVETHPFEDVDAAFAFDEGEGDRSLRYWREAHWHFFGITCQEIGREPSKQMPVVCERFKVVYPTQINAREEGTIAQ